MDRSCPGVLHPQGLDHSHTASVLLSETTFFPCLDLSSLTFLTLLPRPKQILRVLSQMSGLPQMPVVCCDATGRVEARTQRRISFSVSQQSRLLTSSTMTSHQHFLLCFPQAFFGGLHALVKMLEGFLLFQPMGSWVATSKSLKRKQATTEQPGCF